MSIEVVDEKSMVDRSRMIVEQGCQCWIKNRQKVGYEFSHTSWRIRTLLDLWDGVFGEKREVRSWRFDVRNSVKASIQ
jgi:hypothetical protein